MSKVTSHHASLLLRDYFGHLQVGVGVPEGTEATVHSVRQYIENLETGPCCCKAGVQKCFKQHSQRCDSGSCS